MSKIRRAVPTLSAAKHACTRSRHAVSVAGIAQIYAGLIDTLVIDRLDAPAANDIAEHVATPLIADTVMRHDASSRGLAEVILDHVGLPH